MAQWSEVSQILLNSRVHVAEKVEHNLIKVSLSTDKGRSQDVYVANIDDYVTFSSIVCYLNKVDVVKLMTSDFVKKIPYGLGTVGEFLAIKHVQKLESLDIGELAAPIAELAHFADYIESALSGGDVF